MGAINVFLDTNVLIDFFTGRMNDHLAKKIILCGKTGRYNICASMMTVVNTLYVANNCYKMDLRHSDFESVCIILGQRLEQWKMACGLSEMTDFEDALQTACAIDNKCSVIISRDKHYQNCPVIVYSPDEFIKKVETVR